MGFLSRIFEWSPAEATGASVGVSPPAAAAHPVGASPPRALGESVWIEDWGDPSLPAFLRGLTGGGAMTPGKALSNTTLQRGVSLVSGVMGMLPLHLYERRVLSDGTVERSKARDHAVYRLLHERPNSYQTPVEFKAMLQANAMQHGLGIALKIRDARGQVQELVPLSPSRVTPELDSAWGLTFVERKPSGGTRRHKPDDVFWFRGVLAGDDGVSGVPLAKLAERALSIAAEADRAVERLMKDGVLGSKYLATDKALTEKQFAQIKESMEEYAGGANAGKVPLLEEGLKFHAMANSAREAELLQLLGFLVEEIARVTGVPRPLLMLDETSWGSGIEQLGLFLITYCLAPWFVAWEQAVARSLLTSAEQRSHYAKFNEGALLRGSLKDQAEFFSRARGQGGVGGWMTGNEVRDAFDLNPLPEFEAAPAGSGEVTGAKP